MPESFSVAMTADAARVLRRNLVRNDRQEDLAFALWSPSDGETRRTALLHTPLLPARGDREIHGNVSFMPQYFERACEAALAGRVGVAFLHSHPFPGWQDMSFDDIDAERGMAGAVGALTGLPLLGMTMGSDGTWSARLWTHRGGREFQCIWCGVVRTIGTRLTADFASAVFPPPRFREEFRRTVAVWGEAAHSKLARLRVGIVGLGSVGALVAETLARTGLERLVLIDYDGVERHNLDRLVTASRGDLGRFKVDVAAERCHRVATAEALEVRAVPYSLVEGPGYRAALDCDALFSCVDRPRARCVLDHLAYSHLIPVIDGGIQARFKGERFSGVDWQVQTVGPGRPCLKCLGAYDPGDVSTEAAGKFEDPSYLRGLPDDHGLKRNENVFPFAANLASLEVLQFVALVTGAAGIWDFGVQRFRYVPGILEQLGDQRCAPGCDRPQQLPRGDADYSLSGRDLAAESRRAARG